MSFARTGCSRAFPASEEIARSLGISVETVKEHVQNIMLSLGRRDRTQAGVWAVWTGMV